MRQALVGEIPLVSREAEMDCIVAALRAPEPAAFVLAGPAGVGKTRLAAEAARSAGDLGFATATAVGSRAAATIPFGPFASFLPASGHTPGDLLGLLTVASDAIAERGGPDHRLLLVVDDAQWLDDGSAALVNRLVRERICGVVACVRVPGPVPDPVTALWKDSLAERIDLGSWTEEQTETALTAVLGGPVARATVRQLWEMSRGNALYLRELLIGAADSGVLRTVGGIWSLNAPLTAPARLVELVAARLASLAPESVAVVEVLAIGEPLGLPVLEGLVSPAGLEDAEARGFVHVAQDGRRTEARLSHPVYGEALRLSLPRSRQRRISATLAGAVRATGTRRGDDLLRLGRWQLDSGVPGEPDVLGRAAARAAEMFDLDLAARLARSALDLGGGVDPGMVLGESLFRSGKHAEAEEVLAGLVPLCGTDADAARVASARAHNLHNLMSKPAEAAAVLDQALTVVTETAPRLELLGRLATIRLLESDPGGALAAAEGLLASGHDAAVSRGAYVSSIALAQLGRCEEALRVAEVGQRSHRRASGLRQQPTAQLIGGILANLGAGRLGQAEADAAAAYLVCLEAGDKEGQATFLFLSGCVLVQSGQLGRAAKVFLDGASVNREIVDPAALRWCVAGLALAEGMAGHAAAAQAAAAELDELRPGAMTIYEPEVIERGRAWARAAAGEHSLACEILAAAAARARACELRVPEAQLLHDLARLGRPEQVVLRLAELAETVDGELVPALACHASALAAADATGVREAADALVAAGSALLAAEAYQAAAVLLRSDGYARQASTAARRAEELIGECGGVRTPALAAVTSAGGLTRREREIAVMAAAGASSREIADRLVLSVRTVDNHLQNAYSKLGVTSRSELARVLGS